MAFRSLTKLEYEISTNLTGTATHSLILISASVDRKGLAQVWASDWLSAIGIRPLYKNEESRISSILGCLSKSQSKTIKYTITCIELHATSKSSDPIRMPFGLALRQHEDELRTRGIQVTLGNAT